MKKLIALALALVMVLSLGCAAFAEEAAEAAEEEPIIVHEGPEAADELMERFVRGDSSRSTEGSGLGLSIARSLTELMGGAMRLTLDGDLFKAELVFPVAAPPPKEPEVPQLAAGAV